MTTDAIPTTHAAVGCAVTPKWTLCLRSWCKTMKTMRSRNVAVGKTKKSIEARAFEWLSDVGSSSGTVEEGTGDGRQAVHRHRRDGRNRPSHGTGTGGEGAEVVLVGLTADKGAEVCEAIRRSSRNGRVRFEQADLSSQAEIRALVERLTAGSAAIDVLVNNVGAVFTEPRRPRGLVGCLDRSGSCAEAAENDRARHGQLRQPDPW